MAIKSTFAPFSYSAFRSASIFTPTTFNIVAIS